MAFAITSKAAKDEIKNTLGDIDGIELPNNQVLVAIFIRPEKTAGGIIYADTTGGRRDEDKWQGKVGLIVKAGPDAFVDPEKKWFKGVKFSVGDWIYYRASDGWAISVNGVLCRQMEDIVVKGKVDHPERLF